MATVLPHRPRVPVALRDVRSLDATPPSADTPRGAIAGAGRRRALGAGAIEPRRSPASSSTTPAASSIRAPCPRATTTPSPRRSPASPRRRRIASGARRRGASIGFSRRWRARSGARRALEVAMGLETAHPAALDRLNKRFTLDDSPRRRAAARPRRRAARVPARSRRRSCPADEQDDWLLRSVDAAFACGASVVSLVPTRPGNGAIEALEAGGFPGPASRRHRAQLRRGARRIAPATAGLRRPLGSRAVRRLRRLPRRAPRSPARDESRAARPAGRLVPGLRRCCRTVTSPLAVEPPRSTPTSRSSAPASPARSPRSRSGSAATRVVLIERGRHPRFAIGESSTPLANLLIEELADRYDLPRRARVLEVGHLAAGASRGRLRPEARLHVLLPPARRSRSPTTRDHQRQLLVAASPHDEIADTHWYRPEFDQALVEEAQAEGAIYLDETRLESLRDQGGDRTILDGERDGGPSASAPLRHRRERPARVSAPRARPRRTPSLAGCRRRRGFTRTSKASSAGTRLMPPPAMPPYPIDDAALHHVFPGGWIWMLRFNNGLTSAGAALTDPAGRRVRRGRRRAGMGSRCSTIAAVGRRSVPRRRGRRCRSSTRRASRFAARGSRRPAGRCCRRRPASSIRCCRPAFR